MSLLQHVHLLYDGQQSLIVLISAFIINEVFKSKRIFLHYLYYIFPKDKRLQILVTSIFSGILPLEDRIISTIPLYEGLVANRACCMEVRSYGKKTLGSKQCMGIISYLATHHYYLWSPFEKSVIIILAGMHFTYLQFISYTAPLLFVYLLFFVIFVWHNIDADGQTEHNCTDTYDHSIKLATLALLPFFWGIVLAIVFTPAYVFPIIAFYYCFMYNVGVVEAFKSVRWLVILEIAIIIVIANVLNIEAATIQDWLHYIYHESEVSLLTVVPLAVVASFVLGASSKYAGITTSLCSVFGATLFPLVFIVEYLGYLLSPTHKCSVIAWSSFKTPLVLFYGTLLMLAAGLLAAGLLEYSLVL